MLKRVEVVKLMKIFPSSSAKPKYFMWYIKKCNFAKIVEPLVGKIIEKFRKRMVFLYFIPEAQFLKI